MLACKGVMSMLRGQTPGLEHSCSRHTLIPRFRKSPSNAASPRLNAASAPAFHGELKEWCSACSAEDVPHDARTLPDNSARQVFVTDPNGVNVGQGGPHSQRPKPNRRRPTSAWCEATNPTQINWSCGTLSTVERLSSISSSMSAFPSSIASMTFLETPLLTARSSREMFLQRR